MMLGAVGCALVEKCWSRGQPTANCESGDEIIPGRFSSSMAPVTAGCSENDLQEYRREAVGNQEIKV